ncbi:peptidoglycan-binding protein [Streptomyces sp. NPDC020801]|uniref:peptidoglycan-binding domain-containing protein n=1 Tax=unclassified Streptomyces TaxID=2593676 RepID=UPI0037BDEB35
MGFNDADPWRALTSPDDPAQEIRDSFQSILDALDAARADLHAMEEQRHYGATAEYDDSTAPTHRTSQDAVVSPLWARGLRPAVEPPPVVAEPPTGGRTVPPHHEPTAILPLPAPAQADARRRTDPPAATSRPAAAQCWTPPEPPPTSSPLPGQPLTPAQKESRGHRRFAERRHTRAAGIFGLGAVSGLLLASSLFTDERTTPAQPSASVEQPDHPLPDSTSLPQIPGTGLLREGDSGHGVYELQVRLLQIPHIYDGGAINGRYDMDVRQAVARFQNRYGIRGDESGVYGDNTRYALMLHTK